MIKRANLRAPALVLLAVAVALTMVACGGDDDKSASRTSPPQAGTDQGGSAGRHAKQGDGESSGGDSNGSPGGGGASSGAAGSGGADAPQVDRPVRRRSLARYLAERYRTKPWYGTIVRIRTGSGKVRVNTSIDVESDDESTPLVICRAILAYSTRIKRVTVVGESLKLVPTKLLRVCGEA